jgi:hypothetical protein
MNEAVPRARAEPSLIGVARGTRRGETVQVWAPAAVLDLDAAVHPGDENPFSSAGGSSGSAPYMHLEKGLSGLARAHPTSPAKTASTPECLAAPRSSTGHRRQRPRADPVRPALSPRELEVLRLLTEVASVRCESIVQPQGM